MASDRILVVDDDALQRDGLSEILEARGYRTACAANGWQALELATEERPSLILLDLEMPVMTGWEVLSALHRSAALSDIPVIVVTGHSEAPSGVVSLAKPVRIEALLAYIGRVLGSAAQAPVVQVANR